jgi:hypothetical protein
MQAFFFFGTALSLGNAHRFLDYRDCNGKKVLKDLFDFL